MAIKNTIMGGTNWADGDTLVAADLNDTINAIGQIPIGGVIDWLKTYSTVSSGTADTNTVDKLVDTSATFVTDGVTAGMIVYNSTDDTFAIVSAVDSETSLSLAADTQSGSAVTDVFPDGNENYSIYATPKLNPGWYELNGQTISDANSVYNGATLPDVNNSTQSFIRGANKSGGTGGSETHNHQWYTVNGSTNNPVLALATPIQPASMSYNSSGTAVNFTGTTYTTNTNLYTNKVSTLPTYYEMVKIIRIK